jgi:hypothetical protein
MGNGPSRVSRCPASRDKSVRRFSATRTHGGCRSELGNSNVTPGAAPPLLRPGGEVRRKGRWQCARNARRRRGWLLRIVPGVLARWRRHRFGGDPRRARRDLGRTGRLTRGRRGVDVCGLGAGDAARHRRQGNSCGDRHAPDEVTDLRAHSRIGLSAIPTAEAVAKYFCAGRLL